MAGSGVKKRGRPKKTAKRPPPRQENLPSTGAGEGGHKSMKVILTANCRGNYDANGDPGDVLEVSEENGQKLIEEGLAMAYKESEDKPIERAVNAGRETATHPAQKK